MAEVLRDEEYPGQNKFQAWFDLNVLADYRHRRMGIVLADCKETFLNGQDHHVREIYHVVSAQQMTLKEYVESLTIDDMQAISDKIMADICEDWETPGKMCLTSESDFLVKYTAQFLALEEYYATIYENRYTEYMDEMLGHAYEIMSLFNNHIRDPKTCKYTLFPLTTEPPKLK